MGYVWCEIRQQSSEEPCDETSFGKKSDEDLHHKSGWAKIDSIDFEANTQRTQKTQDMRFTRDPCDLEQEK